MPSIYHQSAVLFLLCWSLAYSRDASFNVEYTSSITVFNWDEYAFSLSNWTHQSFQHSEGFFVVLLLQPTDYVCTGIEHLIPVSPVIRQVQQRLRPLNYRAKNVTLTILPTPNRWDYILPILTAIGFFASFYLIGGIVICVHCLRSSTPTPPVSTDHNHRDSTEPLIHPNALGSYGTAPIEDTEPLIQNIHTSEHAFNPETPPSSVTHGFDQNRPISAPSPLHAHVYSRFRIPGRSVASLVHTDQSVRATLPVRAVSMETRHGLFSSSDEDVADSEDNYPVIFQRTSSHRAARLAAKKRTRPPENDDGLPTSSTRHITQEVNGEPHVTIVCAPSISTIEAPVTTGSVPMAPPGMFLFVSDLSRKRYTTLNRKYVLYFWYLIIVSVFYGLPAIQLIMIYQKALVETGNQDMCYYNFECARPLGIFTAFNNIISNLGYVMLGLLFLVDTTRRDLLHRRRMKLDPIHAATHGIPQHYGLYYAIGFALTMEGIMSAGYHMCPSFSNFQFDTAFMYILAMLLMLKIYQTRHPDVNASAHSAYMVMALIIFLGVTGVLYGSETFWIAFTIIFLLLSVVITAEIYYMGQWNIDFCLPRRLYALIRADGIHILRPVHLERMLFLLVVNVTNFSLAGYGVVMRPRNFSTFLLSMFMINLLSYTAFYILMKLRHRERILRLPVLYILAGATFWAASIYLFFQPTTTWELTPAESRARNQPCILMNFYDSHDVWHFLSATSMFFSFMMLVNLDDDLIDRPRNQIAVF